MNNELFGLRLRGYRKEKGMTIETLAEQIGLSPNYLGDVERGKKLPSMKTFIRLVNVLDISADELLKNEVNRADYLVDAEISKKLRPLPPRTRTALLNILDTILASLPLLDEEPKESKPPVERVV